MEYLYYKRGEEWVRVNANTFTQLSEPGSESFTGGQCEGMFYRVFATCLCWQTSTDTKYTGYYASARFAGATAVKGPVSPGSIISPSPAIGGLSGTSYGPEARINTPIGERSLIAYDNTLNPKRGGILRNPSNQVLSGFITSVVPISGVDNCGDAAFPSGECETKFYSNGSLVLTLSSCPEVTNGRGCSDCCGELLPMLRSLHI